jgi:mannose-1-phosphate guanylyltransferase
MATSHRYGLILAGGRGTRFWPRSRRARAKQVLNFFGEQSLIQATVDRLTPLLPPEKIWILTNEHLRAEIVKQLPEVPKRQILAEPAQRNTAPAIGLAAHILNEIDPDSVMGVFPADHIITKPARYLRLLRPAFKAAEQGKIVVLGIKPRWAETGYGYIEFPQGVQPGLPIASEVLRFREKPDKPAARRLLATGRCYWNAGMFFWRTSVLIDALREHLPGTEELLASIPPLGSKNFATSLATIFPSCEKISIDHAVLEKASGVVGLAADDIGWNDVGSWDAVFDLLSAGETASNVGRNALAVDSTGNLVDANGKLVALLGVKDLVIVDTPDALLIADRKRAQDVGKLVELLEEQKRDELL